MTDIRKQTLYKCHSSIGHARNLYTKSPIHFSLQCHAWLQQEQNSLERTGIISTSNFASPIIIVPKKYDPSTKKISYRMVVDFRKIKQQHKYWSHPVMSIDRIFSKVYGPRLFLTLDVRSVYYNITVAEDSRKYTTFTTEYGKYEFLRVLFGICVAPIYFALMIKRL